MLPLNSAEVLALLRKRRKAAGITGAQLAAELGPGWTQSVISERERGKRRTTLRQVDAWMAALDRMTKDR